ncbi:MAG: DUF4199 domain-containing protein [Acidobacteriota bacterium]
MKKTILMFGVISGLISAAFMSATVPFIDNLEHGAKGLVVGYTGMVLAFLLIYFGIRSYRENYGGGVISFWRGFVIGLSITVLSSLFYVVTWEVIFFKFMPHFMDGYAAHAVDAARAAGKSAAQVAALQQQMDTYIHNPLANGAMTFIEPFPVGLLMTLISAGILRRKAPVEPTGAVEAASV